MAVTAASLVVKVRADTSEAESALRSFHGNVERSASGLARSFDGLRSSLASFGGGFAGAFSGTALVSGLQTATGLLAGIGREAMDVYGFTERLRMSLTNMAAKEFVQSGQASDMAAGLEMASERAAELEAWIRKIAIESPFGREDVAGAFRMGMAYGFTSEQAQRLTQATIDYSTATGQSGAVMSRISLALGQIQARGKLSAQELNQLSEAGVNARGILADAFGVTTQQAMEMIEKGLIPANVAVETIIKNMEDNYGGAAARATESMGGLLNSIGDLKGETLENLFGPAFEKGLVPALSSVASILQDPAFQEGVKNFGAQMGEVAGMTLDATADAVVRIANAYDKADKSGAEPGWVAALRELTSIDLSTSADGINDLMIALGNGGNSAETLKALEGIDWSKIIGADAAETISTVVGGLRQAGDIVKEIENAIGSKVQFTANWQDGTLAKLTTEAITQLTLATQSAWETSITMLPDTGPITDALASTWQATVSLLPDIQPIIDALSRPFKAAVDFVASGTPRVARGTNDRTPDVPLEDLWNTITGNSRPDSSTTLNWPPTRNRAVGDRSFFGGWAIVGERGPELINLPGGTQILTNTQTRQLLGAGVPGFADGTGAPIPSPDTLKKAGAAFAGGNVSEFQALMGLTDAVKENTKAQKEGNTAFADAISNVEGLFGTSQVTRKQMDMAELGVPQNFADNYLRRLTDEVMNGVDWEGVDIQDAASRAGIDPNLPAEAILEMFRQAWADSSLFANSENLDLIDKGAVEESIKRQQEQLQGQANIMALFGLTDENLTGQIEGLGVALSSGLNGAIKPEQFTGVGQTAFAGTAAAFTDEDIAATAMTNAAGAMASAVSVPAVSSAWADAGAAAWGSFTSGFGPTGAAPGPPTEADSGGIPHFAAGGVARGGLAWVGENGPELVSLPSGTRVYDAASSADMAGTTQIININAIVREQLDLKQLVWEVKRELKRGK